MRRSLQDQSAISCGFDAPCFSQSHNHSFLQPLPSASGIPNDPPSGALWSRVFLRSPGGGAESQI